MAEAGVRTNEKGCGTYLSTRALLSLQLALDRITHSLRTPLGVAKGVVADIAAGYPFDTKDIESAMSAIDQLGKLLKQFNQISTPISVFSEGSMLLSDVRVQLRRAAADRGVSLQEVSTTGLNSIALGSLYYTCIEQGLCYLCKKLGSRRHERNIKLNIGRTENGLIALRFTGYVNHPLPIYSTTLVADIYQVVAEDSTPEVLGLLYATEILAANGGGLMLNSQADIVRLELRVPILESNEYRGGGE